MKLAFKKSVIGDIPYQLETSYHQLRLCNPRKSILKLSVCRLLFRFLVLGILAIIVIYGLQFIINLYNIIFFDPCNPPTLHWKNAEFTNLNPKLVGVSTCSDRVSRLGPKQHVVAFNYYGAPSNSGRNYFKGIAINAKLMVQHYPGWRMRVYHNLPMDAYPEAREELAELACFYKFLDLCYVGDIPGYGNILKVIPFYKNIIWRYLPLSDPLVDVMISRDLDSRLGHREAAAVSDWLENSTAALHVMRDHPFHGVHILGGAWGARLSSDRELWTSTLKSLLQQSQVETWGNDQYILMQIWKMAGTKPKGFALQHDSQFCLWYPLGEVRPFPTRRENKSYNFIGANSDFFLHDVICPPPCRKHQEWIYC